MPRSAEQELEAALEVRLRLGLRCCGFLPVGVSAQSPCRCRGNLASQKWA